MTADGCAHARALVAAGQYEAALHELGLVLAAAPENVTALCLAANACLGLGRLGDALDSASKAAVLAPDDDWPLRLISLTNARMGRSREAVQAAELAIKVAPTSWATHYQLAASRYMTHRSHSVSLDAITESIRLAPDNADAHRLAGRLNLELGHRPEAARCFRQALKLDPHDAVARHELARIELKRGRLGSAADGFGNAVAMDPRLSSGVTNLDLVVLLVLRCGWSVLLATTLFALIAPWTSLVDATVASVALALGALYLWRKAGRRLRTYLRYLPRRDSRLAWLATLLLVAWIALWLNRIAPGTANPGLVALILAGVMHRTWLARRRYGSK